MYAGLASIMVVIVFLYMVGVIFIIGAEFNAALMKFNVLPSRTVTSKPDEPADLF